MPFTEDLAVFINADTPGYTLATIGTGTVSGLFDNAYVDSFGVTNSEKTFTCRVAEVPGLVTGNAVTIAATSYTVAELQPDGTGLVRVRLK